jgi:uncharacterized protein (DUF1330 family)
MPAYVISEVTVLDQRAVAAYKPLARQAALAFGGQYLARDAVPDVLEGAFEPDERVVILCFPDVQAAHEWYSSEAYADALALTAGGLQRRLFIVDGA